MRESEKQRRERHLLARLNWFGRLDRRDLETTFGLGRSRITEVMNALSTALVGRGVVGAECRRGVLELGLGDASIEESLALDEVLRRDENLPFSYEDALPLARFSTTPPVMRSLARSARTKTTIVVEYGSMHSGDIGERPICPHTLVRSAHRLHVRAYDHRRGRFSDFVLGRIFSARAAGPGEALKWVPRSADGDWNTRVPLTVRAHPALSRERKAIVEREWQMQDGRRVLQVRRANLLYVLETLLLREIVLGLLDRETIPPSGLVCENADAVRVMLGALTPVQR